MVAKEDLPEVRLAVPSDEEAIMAMCRRLHEENGLFTLNDEKVRDCIRRSYDRKGGIVGVVDVDGVIEASMCLMVSDFYYTDDWHLAELWNYVEEPYRRSYNARALLDFAKGCSERMKVPLFTGIITNKQMAGKVRMYRQMLGYPTGAFFVYNAKWTSEPIQDYTDLRGRLREAAKLCNDRRLSPADAARKIAPLLNEAATAIGGEEDIWGAPSSRKSNAHVRGAA